MNAINEARKAAKLTYKELAANIEKQTGLKFSPGYLKQLGVSTKTPRPSETLALALCHILGGLKYEALRPPLGFRQSSDERNTG